MNYKFIDIGCGMHSVSSDIFGTEVKGIYVEPIKEYLDILLSGKNIRKECCVISDKEGLLYFNAVVANNPKYYSQKKFEYVYNNTSLSNYYAHKYDGSGQSSLEVKHPLSKKIKVKSVTLENFFKKYNVTSVDYLKIDVEGHEEVVLNQLIDLLLNKKIKINTELKFEYNKLSDLKKLDVLTNKICEILGFESRFNHHIYDEDMILTKKQ